MGFFKSLDSIEDIESTPIGVKFSVVEYKSDSFLQKILDGTLSNNKIETEIMIGYRKYFDYDNFNDPNLRPVFQALWTNLQFLKCVLRVLEDNVVILSEVRFHYIITINKIAYDYYSDNLNEMKDSEVLNTLFAIVDKVNINYILPLSSIMDKPVARFISMAKFSSFEYKESIKRLNKFITCLGYDFSIKDIIYIYGIFYSDNFSTLFITTIMDYQQEFLNPLENKMYDNISLALLYILNSMESVEIYKSIRRYVEYIMLMNVSTKVRFSLNNLAEDFSRVNNVVETLKYDGFEVP